MLRSLAVVRRGLLSLPPAAPSRLVAGVAARSATKVSAARASKPLPLAAAKQAGDADVGHRNDESFLMSIFELTIPMAKAEVMARGLSRAGSKLMILRRLANDVVGKLSAESAAELAERHGLEHAVERDLLVSSIMMKCMADPTLSLAHQALCEKYFINMLSLKKAVSRDSGVLSALEANAESLHAAFVHVFSETASMQDFGLLISEEPRLLHMTLADFTSILIFMVPISSLGANMSISLRNELIIRLATAYRETKKKPTELVADLAGALKSSDDAAASLMRKYPAVLSMGTATIAERVLGVKTIFHLSDSEFLRVLANNPRMLTYSQASLEAKARNLANILGLDVPVLGPMLVSQPTFISLSPAALEERAKYISTVLELNASEASHFFRHYMGILALHKELNLKPKFDFLINVCGFSKEAVRQYMFVLKHGLWTRIIPRVDLCAQNKIELSLSHIAKSNAVMDGILGKEHGFTAAFHASWNPEKSLIKERPEYKESFLRKPKRSV
jgi:hypothetical protein